MASRYKLKDSFEVQAEHSAFFTGSQITWTDDGSHLLCQDGAKVHMLELESGQVTSTFKCSAEIEDIKDDPVTALAVCDDEFGKYLFTSYRSGLIIKWCRTENKILRSWKSIHKGPVARLAVDEDSIWLATGGSDSRVRIWELATFNCIQSLKGCQGVISALKFRPGTNEIFAAGDDCSIRSWNVSDGVEKHVLESHYSQVTAFAFHGNQLVSCGRDSVICLWDLKEGKLLKTIPVYESLEGMVMLPKNCILPGNYRVDSGPHVAVAGEKGVVRVWQVEKAKEVYVQSNSQISQASEAGGLAVTSLMLNKNTLAMVGVDHTIVFHSIDTFKCQKLLVGYCDEILDMTYLGKSDSHLAVASNSPDIKLYRLKDMHCTLLKGHTDLVLSLASSPKQRNLLASSAKDNKIKLWLLDEESGEVSCIATGERHTASVGAVAFSQTSVQWLFTGAQDNCIKAWQIGSIDSLNTVLDTRFSAIAHDKEINSLCVSPNDKILASASQDKTVKLWNVEGLTLIGALRGHKRGVWCVRFSPADQILITGSADSTIKLWNLADLTCIKTLEGHDSSVLKLEFLTSGTQIFSCGGDGLLKLWTIKSSECTLTLDGHEGRVWALAVKSEENELITGGGDSKLVVWKDTTVEKQEASRLESQQRLQQDQTLSNLMHSKHYDSALELALRLDRPNTVLKIVQILSKEEKWQLRAAVKNLEPELQSSLLQLALKWNSNTRNCASGQLILEFMLTEGSIQLSSEDLAHALAYTTKHFQRLSQLRADMHFLTYTAAQMALLPNEM